MLAGEPWLAVATFLIAFGLLIGAIAWFHRTYSPHPELPRKLLHTGSGLLTLTFPFLFEELWPVFLLTAGSVLVISAVKFCTPLRKRIGSVVDGVSRPTLGEIYFPVSVAILFWLAQGQSPLYFCIPMLVLTLADATGALIGVRYGQSRFAGASKSVEGSVAFLVVAFFCLHVPLVLWTETGKVETLLMSLTMAMLVMLLEGSAWRGLDNLFIPIGGYFLLQTYLPLGADELLRRLLVTAALVVAVLAFRRSSTMLDDALLAGALLCYVTWAVAGWHWIVPPAIAFIGYALSSADEPDHGQRFHTVAAMLAIWAAAIAWLVIAGSTGRLELIFPFTLVFACHMAIFGLSRTSHRLATSSLGTLATLAVLEAWILLLVPFVVLEGITGRNVLLALLGGPAIALAVVTFTRVEPDVRNLSQSLVRWRRQTASAAGGSAVGWLFMVVVDSWARAGWQS